MRNIISTLITLTCIATSCSTSTVDFENERLKVRQELFENMFQSFKAKDADGAVMRVPESGNLLVESGEIKKYEREFLRKHYKEDVFPNADFKAFEIVEEPKIEFFDNGNSCYGTIKIKITLGEKADTINTDKDLFIAMLFVGQKQNGHWVSLADSQTFPISER
jgi:hypothetical protein